MKNWKWPSRSNITVGIIVVLLLLAAQFHDRLEQWLVRLALGTLFCTVIYLRDHSNSDRWITIAIIAIGTALSVLLMK